MINNPEAPRAWQVQAQCLVVVVKDSKQLREKARKISNLIVI